MEKTPNHALIALRTTTNLTQQAFAAFLKVNQKTYNKYEKGETSPPDYFLEYVQLRLNHAAGHLPVAKKWRWGLLLHYPTVKYSEREFDSAIEAGDAAEDYLRQNGLSGWQAWFRDLDSLTAYKVAIQARPALNTQADVAAVEAYIARETAKGHMAPAKPPSSK